MKQKYTGINIQYPISRLILNKEKVIETRTYPIPRKLIGKEMLLVETPGPSGNFKSRIVAVITFGESFKYPSKAAFYADAGRHKVTPDSRWAWHGSKGKYGWPILSVRSFRNPIPMKRKPGIVYSLNLSI